MKKLTRLYLSTGVAMTMGMLSSGAAHATTGATSGADVTGNIATSISNLPGLVTALAYLMGSVLGVLGVLKIKEHVENPQTPLKEGAIKLCSAGALFALPFIFEVMMNTISGGDQGTAPSISTMNTLTAATS